jgi:very-short-patch-repair endonuclease
VPDLVIAGLAERQHGGWELWTLTPHLTPPPEVTRVRNFRSRPGIAGHRFPLPKDETAQVNWIPVTSVPRTLLDLASVLTKRQLERALNEAEVLRLTDRLSLPDLLERYPRRTGSAVLRTLLREGVADRGITRSELERRFLAVLEGTGLPRPRLNARVSVRGRLFEADCLWSRQRVIVELDGRAVHGTRRAFEDDRERDRLLQAGGWRVIRITWRQLRDDAPAVVADLRRLLRE